MILCDRQSPQLVAPWSQRLIRLFYVKEYFADVIKFLITFHENIRVIKIWSQDSKKVECFLQVLEMNCDYFECEMDLKNM